MNLKSFSGILFLISLIILSSCTGIRKMSKNTENIGVKVTPEPLMVKADTIEFEVIVSIPEGYFSKKAHMEIYAELEHEEGVHAFDPFYLIGEKSKFEAPEGSGYRVIERSKGATISITEKVAYQESMFQSVLYLNTDIGIKSEHEELDKCFYVRDSVNHGTNTTPLLANKQEKTAISGEMGPEVVNEAFKIYFPIESHIITNAERRGEEVKRMNEFAKTDRLSINGISVHAFSSPDGPYDYNKALSERRQESTYRFISSHLRSIGIDAVHDTNFLRASTDEDWSGFKALVKEADLENREEIIELLNQIDFLRSQKSMLNGDFLLNQTASTDHAVAIKNKEDIQKKLSETEDRIRAYEDDWKVLAEDVFPKLRRSVITLHGYMKLRDKDEIMKIGADNPEELMQRELLIYAYHSPDIAERKKIYELYISRDEDDWIGYNNLGVVYLEKGETESAFEQFSKANELSGGHHETLNNLAIVNIHKKDYKAAISLLKKAKEAGMDVDYNLGMAYLKKGNYSEAVKYFDNFECDHNAALALSLIGEPESALERIECITDKTAENFYLRAVVASKTDNIDLMTTSLSRAVSKDGNYREKALKDISFINYRDDARFKNALR